MTTVVDAYQNVSYRSKIAAGAFIFGKANSIFAAMMMFVDRPIAAVLIGVAGLSIATSVYLCITELSKKG